MDHPLVFPIIMQIIGIGIIMAEVLIPSGGLLSILAIVLFGYSLFSVFTTVSTQVGIGFVIADLIIVPVTIIFAFKTLAKSPVTLRKKLSSDQGFSAQKKSLKHLIGNAGTTITDLRPSGIASIDNERLDVVTDGRYIPKDTPVKVVSVTGNQVIVEEVSTGDKNRS